MRVFAEVTEITEIPIYAIPLPWVLAGLFLLGLLLAALVAFLLWLNRRPQG